MDDVNSFYVKYDTNIPSMDELAPLRVQGMLKCKIIYMTIKH